MSPKEDKVASGESRVGPYGSLKILGRHTPRLKRRAISLSSRWARPWRWDVAKVGHRFGIVSPAKRQVGRTGGRGNQDEKGKDAIAVEGPTVKRSPQTAKGHTLTAKHQTQTAKRCFSEAHDLVGGESLHGVAGVDDQLGGVKQRLVIE